MGRQVGFFALEDDIRELLRLCERNGLREVPAEIRTGAFPQPALPSSFTGGHLPALFYLLPPDVTMEAVVYLPAEDPRVSILQPDESVALQVVTCRKDDGAIHDGRVYFNTHRSHPLFGSVKREFERLSRYIGKWPCTSRFRFHVGPAAEAAAGEGRLQLVHVGYGLTMAKG